MRLHQSCRSCALFPQYSRTARGASAGLIRAVTGRAPITINRRSRPLAALQGRVPAPRHSFTRP
ncbi:type II toxin-antitoxin system prevent-host-death family antitoxin [Marivita sp.]|uniref:type II toxin-antitoxin system prevent-host-death family antitoxin n=1 Tax=Marivita sp. TaxID=2003365 RepID=UPI003452F2AE